MKELRSDKAVNFKIVEPLYRTTTNAPDTDTRVPNNLARLLDLLKSSVSILV